MCKTTCEHRSVCPLYGLRKTRKCWYTTDKKNMPLRTKIMQSRKNLIEKGLVSQSQG